MHRHRCDDPGCYLCHPLSALQVEHAEQHGPAPIPDNPEFCIDLCICGEEWPHEGAESTEESAP